VIAALERGLAGSLKDGCLFTDHVLWVLVASQAQEDGLTHLVVARPFQ
jgi:hypothetical protein